MDSEADRDEMLSATLRALAHPVRLSILRILSARRSSSCCCTDVTECLPLAQSTVSQHIKVLLDAGLIERQPQGTRNCYVVRADRLAGTALDLGSFISGMTTSAPAETALTESA